MSRGSTTLDKCIRFSLDPAFGYLLVSALQYAGIYALRVVDHVVLTT